MRISDWSSDVCLPISRTCPSRTCRRPRHYGCRRCSRMATRRRADRGDLGATNGGSARHYIRPAAAQYWQPSRSEEHTSELQSLMRTSYAVFCLKKKNYKDDRNQTSSQSTIEKLK